MKTFKQFYTKPAEFIAFSNAGGKEGQYDRFDYTESFMYGQGGGPKTSLDENLNPRANPEYIQSMSNTFFDPERNTLGLAEDHNMPRNLGIPDYYGNEYVHPTIQMNRQNMRQYYQIQFMNQIHSIISL